MVTSICGDVETVEGAEGGRAGQRKGSKELGQSIEIPDGYYIFWGVGGGRWGGGGGAEGRAVGTGGKEPYFDQNSK